MFYYIVLILLMASFVGLILGTLAVGKQFDTPGLEFITKEAAPATIIGSSAATIILVILLLWSRDISVLCGIKK